MRFLHTSDWHLGRTIKGQSRQSEFEQVLLEVVDIARRERVDALLIAGDTFETFSPPPEAERLLYETLTMLLRDGVQIVMIAGNHDDARRMDALTQVLRFAGIHCVGSLPKQAADAVVRLPSRDGSEEATIVALPWMPERYLFEYESLLGPLDETLAQYKDRAARVVQRACEELGAGTINVLMAHLLVDGVTIGEGSGERRLHIGQAFAVDASCFPDVAQYVALGHVHRPQQMLAAAPAHYSGSLVQLDFGEAEQDKFVNVVEAGRGLPANVTPVRIDGGRRLRNLRLPLADLHAHAGRYGDDYLKVTVECERHEVSLYDRVRDVLPNALEVIAERIGAADDQPSLAPRGGLAPHELFARYYAEKTGGELPETLATAFRELYEAEGQRAPA